MTCKSRGNTATTFPQPRIVGAVEVAVGSITLPEGVDPAAGREAGHVCALKNGAVYCWGDDSLGQRGDGQGDSSTATDGSTLQPTTPIGARVDHVRAGPGRACAITHTKELWCWGNNSHGQVILSDEQNDLGSGAGAAV